MYIHTCIYGYTHTHISDDWNTIICGGLFLWAIPARIKKFEEHSGHISYMYVQM